MQDLGRAGAVGRQLQLIALREPVQVATLAGTMAHLEAIDRPRRPSRRASWRAKVSLAAGLVAGLFVLALYARQEPGRHQRLGPDLGRHDRRCFAARAPTRPSRCRPGRTGCCIPCPPCCSPSPFTFVPLPLARGTLRGDRDRGVHLRRHAAPPLDPLLPDQRRDAVELDGRAVAAAADRGRADARPLLAARGQAHAGLRALGGLAEPQGGASAAFCSSGSVCWSGPDWVQEWLASVARTPHEPHLLRPGGFLLLLGLLRWRQARGAAARRPLPGAADDRAVRDPAPGAAVPESPAGRRVRRPDDAGPLLYQLGPQGPWPVGAEYQWWVLLVLVYLPAIVAGPAAARTKLSRTGLRGGRDQRSNS